MQIQAFLTAAVINLKRLAGAAMMVLLAALAVGAAPGSTQHSHPSPTG